MSVTLYPYVDEELASELAAQGIEIVDCRVNSAWAEPGVDVRPVPHEPLRRFGPTYAVTAGAGLGEQVPAPIHPWSIYDRLMLEPRYQEAAKRGLQIARERGEL